MVFERLFHSTHNQLAQRAYSLLSLLLWCFYLPLDDCAKADPAVMMRTRRARTADAVVMVALLLPLLLLASFQLSTVASSGGSSSSSNSNNKNTSSSSISDNAADSAHQRSHGHQDPGKVATRHML